MAIAFDNASGAGWLGGSIINAVTHTTSGADRFLMVSAGTYSASLVTVSSISYGGVALTKIDSITANVSGMFQDTELWYLDNPPLGSNALIINFSGSADFSAYTAESYTGKTVAGIAASAKSQNVSASTSSPVCNVNVPYSDCWLVGYAYGRDASAPTAGAGTTVRQSLGIGHAAGDSNGVVGTGNQTLSFLTSGAAPWPGVITAAISAANAGGGATINGAVGNASADGSTATVTNLPTTISGAVGNAAASGTTASVTTRIMTDPLINNTETVLASTAVHWSWIPAGRIGSLNGITITDGTGTTDADGRLAPGIVRTAGILKVAKRNTDATDDEVFYQAWNS